MANDPLESVELVNDEQQLNVQQVELYLQQNPQFFKDKDALLQQMQLHHVQQGASSLLERQNTLLRQNNTQLELQLQQFIMRAQENERVFQSVRDCVLSLLSAVDLQQLCENLKLQIQSLFATDAVRVFLFNHDCEPHNSWLSVDRSLLKAYLPALFSSTACICGEFDHDLRMFLFADSAIKSAAVAPLIGAQQQVIGFMVLGSEASDYFNRSLDTLFLTYLSQVLAIKVLTFS